MKYIDWYYKKMKNEVYYEKKQNYKKWQDFITGTWYCISNVDYERIYETGKKKLEQYCKEENLEAVEQFFYNSGMREDVSLFPDLPYFVNGTEKCARIRDYVCIRTAFLYALKYDSIKKSIDIENEKRKLRMQGLTWKIVNSLNENPELEQIDQMLSGNKNIAGNLLKYKADLVKGGIIKIKQYYLETNKIPEIRGASRILEMINKNKIEDVICKNHIKECIVYTGGGKMMGIFPEGCGSDICQKLELLVEEETVTAQSNFGSCTYEMKRLFNDYKKVMEEMDLILEKRQGLRWDFRIEPQIKQKFTKEKLRKNGFATITDKDILCTSCRNRHAVAKYLYENTEEKLCQSCLYKRLEGGRNAKYSMKQKYRSYIKTKRGIEIPESNENSYNKLEDIAENGYIGVIYGDANSMSNQINNLESFMMMRYFSEVTSETIEEIVFEALFQHLKNILSFEVIAIGGDDIFIIVPGNKAYGIACTIGKLFDKKFQNQSVHENGITMSIGVCITHDKMPVQYSFGIVQELLKSAKQKAWEERQEGNITGTIDWMVIENEMAGSADLEFQRMEKPDKPQKTLRPYTWQQARELKIFMNQIKNKKSFVFQLKQSWYQHTKEEAELFYQYQISRNRNSDFCKAFERFALALDGKAEKNTIIRQGKKYSPWLDIIELWDYMGDME